MFYIWFTTFYHMFYESQPLPQVHPFHLGVVVGVLVRLQPSGQRLDALAPHHEELRGKALGVEVQNTRLATRDDSMTPNRSRDGMGWDGGYEWSTSKMEFMEFGDRRRFRICQVFVKL